MLELSAMKQTLFITTAIILSLGLTAPTFAEKATSTNPRIKLEIKKVLDDKATSTRKNILSNATTTKDKLKIAATNPSTKEIKKETSTTTRTDSIKARKADILKEIFLRRHKNDKQATSTISVSTITATATTTTATTTPKKK